jgi:hypothetical protein
MAAGTQLLALRAYLFKNANHSNGKEEFFCRLCDRWVQKYDFYRYCKLGNCTKRRRVHILSGEDPNEEVLSTDSAPHLVSHFDLQILHSTSHRLVYLLF